MIEIIEFLEIEPQEAKFLYQMDRILTSGYGSWNRRTQEMMKRNLLDALKWRRDNKISSYILIVGETGSGKTNVTVKLRDLMMKLYKLDKWYLEVGEGIDFSTKTLVNRYGRNSLIVLDEAQESFNAPSNANIIKRFSRALDSLRKFNIHFLFTTPSVNRINQVLLFQFNWIVTCVWRDHNKKQVETIIEYGAKDPKGEREEYLEHSRLTFSYIPKQEFEEYDRRVQEWGSRSERTYESVRRENVKSIRQEEENRKKLEIIKLAQELIRKEGIALEKKNVETQRKKERVAIHLYRKGATVNLVQDILKVGRGKARAFELAFLSQTNKKSSSQE